MQRASFWLLAAFAGSGLIALEARPPDPAAQSYGYAPAKDRLSELNACIRNDGEGPPADLTLGWPAYLGALLQEVGDELALGPLANKDGRFAEAWLNSSSEEESRNNLVEEVLRRRESYADTPQLLWAGMLRAGIGVPRDPKEALAEFLRVAGLGGESAAEKIRTGFALREALITRLLCAPETGESQELRTALSHAATTDNLPGAFYSLALLQHFEPRTVREEWSAYGNVDGAFDGARAGDPSCIALRKTRDGLKPAVDANLPTALFNLAVVEENGWDGSANEAEARRLYRLAADAGMPDAKRRLAELLAEGRGGPAEPKQALALLREAARDDRMAAFMLGAVLCSGEWGERNPTEGMAQLAAARAHGIWQAGLLQGRHLHRGLEGRPDEPAAKACLLAAGEFAQSHTDDAETAIGLALWDGLIVAPAPEEAPAHWLKVSEDARPALVSLHLATAFRLGRGVERNLAKARKFALNAVKGGITTAALELGEISLAEEKNAEAIRFFRRAAEAGSADALSRLADCADQGIGGPPQPHIAERLREQVRTLRKTKVKS